MPPKNPKRAATISAVEARGVTYRYGDRYALYEVDVSLGAGAPCVILGPNGSGKSTLIDVLSMARRPERGQLLFYDDRRDLVEPRHRGRLTAMLGHEPISHLRLTPRENVTLFFRLWAKKTATPLSTAVTEALETLGLDPWDPRPVGDLSLGSRRRVDLAVVLSLDTPFLLLDEPFAPLDPQSRRLLAHHLRKKSRGHVVAVSTHDESLLPLLSTQAQGEETGNFAGGLQTLRLDAGQVMSAGPEPKPRCLSSDGEAS